MKQSFAAATLAFIVIPQIAAAQSAPAAAVPDAVLRPPPRQAILPTPRLEEQLALPSGNFPAVKIRDVRIIGVKSVPNAAIAAIFAPLAGKMASETDLRGALENAGKLYETAGYALGRAYIPAQTMKDGVLTVRVLEGYVGAVVVNTDTPRVKDTIARYAGHILASRPLRSVDMERYLRLIAEIPGVTATLKLTDMNLQTGAVALVVTVDYHPVTKSFALAPGGNVRGLPVEPYLTVKANDVLGEGDQFTLTTLLSPMLAEKYFLQAGASTPIGGEGWRLASTTSLAKVRSDLLPSNINLSSTQLRSDLQASYPLVKTSDEQMTGAGGVYYSQLHYSLNHGDLAQDRGLAAYTELTDARQISPDLAGNDHIRATFGFALPYAPGIPGSRANATRDFVKLDANGALAYSVDTNISLLMRGDAQESSSSLTAAEEVAYGGDRFGRGYDAGLISGDRGFGVSLQPQYGFPLLPGWTTAGFVFGEYAGVFNTKGDGQPNSALLSTGVGFSMSLGSYGGSLGVAEPLRKVPGLNMGLGPRLFGTLQLTL